MTATVEAVRASIDARARRARDLASRDGAVAELLHFFAALLDEQCRWLDSSGAVVRDVSAEASPADRLRALETGALAAVARRALRWLSGEGPAALRTAAATFAGDDESAWRWRLEASLSATGPAPGHDPVATFVCEATIQPFAELARRSWAPSSAGGQGATGGTRSCPGCGARPVVGVLRERGHGVGRAFVCGRCADEWSASRVVCPACGGMDVERLPVFRADVWPSARLDACEACRTYVKSFDLTVDGAAVPVVDDVATVALDLWAAEQGLTRLRPNLLRL